jgi:hypothetical protein
MTRLRETRLGITSLSSQDRTFDFYSPFNLQDTLFLFLYTHKMSLSKLGVFANLALAASAVLLPPTITAADLGDDSVFEGLVVDPFKRSVALECPSCAVATKDQGKLSWKENAGNTFVSRSPLSRS